MSDQQQQQSGDSGKVSKAFAKNFSKLAAIVGGKENLFPQRKVQGDTVNEIVKELTAERNEKNREEVKGLLLGLLDNYVKFDSEVNAKKKELEKLIETKKKEFNDSFGKLMQRVENGDQYTNNLANILAEAGKNLDYEVGVVAPAETSTLASQD